MTEPQNPREGMMATLRNRRGLIASVQPFDSSEGRLHLVRVEYTDHEGAPEDTVLWEREGNTRLLEPTALPRVGEEPPMAAEDYDALVRSARWSAISPCVTPEGSEVEAGMAVAAPLYGAIQVEDFQLVPLLKALQMPRISLLLADDVGLGKTIEAGLILAELIQKRRVRRVLIMTPASLRHQWRREMRNKFSLTFDVVDREETHSIQRQLGLDANPWRTFHRIITSYHYFKQPDVLEQFRAACRQPEGSAQLPWDLLIVDEAHNLTPSNFGEDSQLARMLRAISPWFEHKLFLTATPHNGHTRSFSGLLEQLDPVRFVQTSDFTAAEKARVGQVVVRRLKRDINELDDSLKRPRRFGERFLEPVPLYFGKPEAELATAFQEFRKSVRSVISDRAKTEQLAGVFATEVLNKRLLSCPYAFADSWFRLKEGLLQEEEATAAEVRAARMAAEEEIDDDLEREGRTGYAAKTVGAWLKPIADSVSTEMEQIDRALSQLGLQRHDDAVNPPGEDARFDRLSKLVRQHLRQGANWVENERLIVFTEYKTTLDYLEARLRETFDDDGERIRVLFGQQDMSRGDRDQIIEAFNNPLDPVRILVATDAAAEGLNLQETARLLLHWDIPWNPSRLEQRNGRLDRHGQARDVTVFHFASEEDADLKFLAHVVQKVHNIREDLGSMGDVFDAAFERRFIGLDDVDEVTDALDTDVESSRGRASIEVGREVEWGIEQTERLERLCREIDLSPETLRKTLETALGIGIGQPRLEGPDAKGRFRLILPAPPQWQALIDDTLRLDGDRGGLGALPGIVFDPRHFVRELGGRPVFRPEKDTVLLHLGHPMFRNALAAFARARFPGGQEQFKASRWTVRRGPIPDGADAVLFVTVEEIAVNDLRESFHQWVHTIRFPVRSDGLGHPLPHVVPVKDRPSAVVSSQPDLDRAAGIWENVRSELQDYLIQRERALTETLRDDLGRRGGEALMREKERFRNRLAEVRKAMTETTLSKLERERDRYLEDLRQLKLYPEMHRDLERKIHDLEEELQRRRGHYEDLLKRLEEEQGRVIDRLLPLRYRLRGQARVFPVAVEIRLREASA